MRTYTFDTSLAVRLRSPLSTLPDGIMSRLFRNVHHHRLYGLFIVKRFQSGDLSFLLS